MESRKALDYLVEHQTKIRSLLAEGATLALEEGVSGVASVLPLRWRMTRALREYQLFKHREVLDPIVASGNHASAQMASAMKRRCIAMGEAFIAHGDRWTGRDLTAEWHRYRADSQALIAILTQHLDRERTEAQQLLGDVERARHGAAPPGSSA